MKFYAQYTRTIITQEIFEAETQDEAHAIARRRSKDLTKGEQEATCDWEVMPYGRLSVKVESGSRPQLFLDETLLNEGQLLAIKNGKGALFPARVAYHPIHGWYLARAEFIGHTYLDMSLTEGRVKDLVVAILEEPNE